jgi:hypothetical protein
MVRWVIPIAIGIVLVMGAWEKLRPVGGDVTSSAYAAAGR